MKKLSSKMKILLIMAICAAMMVPSMALAGENSLLLGEQYGSGDYIVELKPLMGTQSRFVTTSVAFEVVNGTSPGENMASSVMIALLEENGEVKQVVISPKQFNQKSTSNAFGTIAQNSVGSSGVLTISIRVRGPKGANIVLNVTEYYKEVWRSGSNSPTWPH